MSAIMCKGGCAAFRKTNTNIQGWDGFPSHITQTDYPYQFICSYLGNIKLIFSKFEMFQARDGNDLHIGTEGSTYDIYGLRWGGGSWTNLAGQGWITIFDSMLQSNYDIRNYATSDIYFAKTTSLINDGKIERIHDGKYLDITAGYQQWNYYPDSPVPISEWPYQIVFNLYSPSIPLYAELYVATLPIYASGGAGWYHLQLLAAAGAHYRKYTCDGQNWILAVDQIVTGLTGITGQINGGGWIQSNYDVIQMGNPGEGSVRYAKSTTSEQDAGIRRKSRRVEGAFWREMQKAPLGLPIYSIIQGGGLVRGIFDIDGFMHVVTNNYILDAMAESLFTISSGGTAIAIPNTITLSKTLKSFMYDGSLFVWGEYANNQNFYLYEYVYETGFVLRAMAQFSQNELSPISDCVVGGDGIYCSFTMSVGWGGARFILARWQRGDTTWVSVADVPEIYSFNKLVYHGEAVYGSVATNNNIYKWENNALTFVCNAGHYVRYMYSFEGVMYLCDELKNIYRFNETNSVFELFFTLPDECPNPIFYTQEIDGELYASTYSDFGVTDIPLQYVGTLLLWHREGYFEQLANADYSYNGSGQYACPILAIGQFDGHIYTGEFQGHVNQYNTVNSYIERRINL